MMPHIRIVIAPAAIVRMPTRRPDTVLMNVTDDPVKTMSGNEVEKL